VTVSAAVLFTSSTRKLTIHTPPSDAVWITRGAAYCEVPIIPHGYPRNPSERSQSKTVHAAGITTKRAPGRALRAIHSAAAMNAAYSASASTVASCSARR
jgi:hypothetical protein